LRNAKTESSHRIDERFFKRRAQCQDSKGERFFKEEHNAKTAPSHRKDKRFLKNERNTKTASSHRKDEHSFKTTSALPRQRRRIAKTSAFLKDEHTAKTAKASAFF
jgi:hypothetical protein